MNLIEYDNPFIRINQFLKIDIIVKKYLLIFTLT
jgi:hypothetical protein